jgi:hypothetical protein
MVKHRLKQINANKKKVLGGPQSWPCHFGKDINLLSLLGIGT